MKADFHPQARGQAQVAPAYYEKPAPGSGKAFIPEVARIAELN